MEREGSSPHSEAPVISPYPEPDQSNPSPHPTSRKAILILSSNLRLKSKNYGTHHYATLFSLFTAPLSDPNILNSTLFQNTSIHDTLTHSLTHTQTCNIISLTCFSFYLRFHISEGRTSDNTISIPRIKSAPEFLLKCKIHLFMSFTNIWTLPHFRRIVSYLTLWCVLHGV